MTWTLFFTMWLVASVSATLGWVFRAGIENSKNRLGISDDYDYRKTDRSHEHTDRST